MTRNDKSAIIDSLSAQFKESDAVVVCEFMQLTHQELESLRVDARANDTQVQVVKNTLASMAMKDAGYEAPELSSTNIFLWSPDQISACKVADKFAMEKKEKFVIKSGIIEGSLADANRVNAFAKLPSRDELIGMLLSVWTAPTRNFVTGLDNLRAKKEEEAA